MGLDNRKRDGLHAYGVIESNNAALGKGGVFCIADTNTHYGRYFALYCITDTVFATLTETYPNANGVAFSSGGTHVIAPGDRLLGETSAAKCIVESVTVTSGTFAAGTAAGYMIVTIIGSTNIDAAEKLDYVNAEGYVIDDDVCTTAAAGDGGETDPDAITGRTFYGGTTLFGNFTCIDLTSGSVLAYKA